MEFKLGDNYSYNYTVGEKKTIVNCFVNDNSKYRIDLLLLDNKYDDIISNLLHHLIRIDSDKNYDTEYIETILKSPIDRILQLPSRHPNEESYVLQDQELSN